MFSIGEFSMASGIPVRTLRFYHDEGLLVPAAVDPATNYRSYDEHNLEVARVIVALRGLEFSLEEIREILSGCREDGDVLDYLERQKAALAEKQAHYRNLVSRIDALLRSRAGGTAGGQDERDGVRDRRTGIGAGAGGGSADAGPL